MFFKYNCILHVCQYVKEKWKLKHIEISTSSIIFSMCKKKRYSSQFPELLYILSHQENVLSSYDILNKLYAKCKCKIILYYKSFHTKLLWCLFIRYKKNVTGNIS